MLKRLLILLLVPGLIGLTGCAGAGTGSSGTLTTAPGATTIAQHPDWMGDMTDTLRNVPLTKAIIPGSHDAGTYSIKDNAAFSPDLPLDANLAFLKDALIAQPDLGPVNAIVAGWARAQGVDIATQLADGIRYFDLRPLPAPSGAAVLVSHSLYGGDLLAMVDQVGAFIDQHPREVIILDFSHFTDMTLDSHAALITHIRDVFANRLVDMPPGANLQHPMANTLTFGQLWDRGQQVICIYHNDICLGAPGVWRSGTPEDSTHWWPDLPTTAEVKV